jgi:hypothetical protein
MITQPNYSIRRLKRLRRRLWSWHHLVTTWVAGYYSACITLTYAPSHRWDRRDVSRFLNALRGYYKRRGWRFIYFWVAELQQRGAVHYHLIVFIPRGHKLPYPDQRWWRKGSSNICSVRRFAKYLAKYLQKGSQGELKFPKGLRLFGYGGLTWLERAMWRCRWLPKRWWDAIYEVVQGVFYVVRLKGRLVEVLTADGDVLVFEFVRRFWLDDFHCWLNGRLDLLLWG